MARRIELLDSLRGLAATVVVFHHLFVYNTTKFEQFFAAAPILFQLCTFVSDLNHWAVLFFFVLSGFAIALATQTLNLHTREGLNTYCYRRFRRILPLYWVAIVLTLLMGLWTGRFFEDQSYSATNLLGNLFFLQTSDKVGAYWFTPYGLNGPLWSLAYEMFFYLFFPLYLYIIRFVEAKSPWSVYTTALLLSYPLALGAILLRQYWFTPFFSFLAQFPIWLSGYYLGCLYLHKERGTMTVTLVSLGLLSLYLLNLRLGSDSLLNLSKAWFLIVLPGYLLYRSKGQLPFFMLLQKGINFLFLKIGEGSYSIYLMHYVFIQYFANSLQLALWQQIPLLALLGYLSIHLERWVNRQPWLLFKRRYV